MKTKCPICKGTKTSFYCQKNNYRCYVCYNCYTLYIWPPPKTEDLHKLYSGNYEYIVDDRTRARLETRALKICKILRKLNLKGKKLLDIGSGFGLFIKEAGKIFPEVLGIEPAKNLYNFSIKKLHVKAIHSSFEEFSTNNNQLKFDFITLIHVIEHVNSPKKLIFFVKKHLNKNGILFIETPNLDSHLFHHHGKNYEFLTPPDHVNLLSVKSIQKILESNPDLRITKLKTYSYPEHLMGIVKRKLGKISVAEQLPRPSPKSKSLNLFKWLKYLLFDRIIAPLFTSFLNIGNKGSILEIYLRKI